jgi:hypothetical protein
MENSSKTDSSTVPTVSLSKDSLRRHNELQGNWSNTLDGIRKINSAPIISAGSDSVPTHNTTNITTLPNKRLRPNSFNSKATSSCKGSALLNEINKYNRSQNSSNNSLGT